MQRWLLIALLVLLPFTAREVRAAWPVIRRSLPVLVPLGILGVGNHVVFSHNSCDASAGDGIAAYNAAKK